MNIFEKIRKAAKWLNLVAIIVLIYFAVANYLSGQFFLPLGYGLMAIYFLYTTFQTIKPNRTSTLFGLLLLLVALGCLVYGLLNKN